MNLSKDTYATVIAIGVLFIYLFAFAHMSFSIDDGGYMYGAGWRILQGQLLYIDFIYARPPVSPYLNALLQWIIPDNAEYLNIRRFFFIEVFTYSVLSAYIIKNGFSFYFKDIPVALMGTFFFMTNVHFNNYMWHTTDGLLFLTISLWLITWKKQSQLIAALAALFLLLGIGTKQSFYPALVVLPIVAFVLNGKRYGVLLIVWMLLFSLTIAISVNIWFPEELKAWIELSQNESQIKPLIEAGFVVYIVHTALLILMTTPFMFRRSIVRQFKKMMKVQDGKGALELYIKTTAQASLVLLFIFVFIYMFVDFIFPKLIHVLLGGMLVFAFSVLTYKLLGVRFKQKKKEWILMFALISIAWMSSLSWGYKTPVFFSGVIIFFMLVLSEVKNAKKIIFLGIGLLLIAVPIIISERGLFKGGKNLSIVSKKLNSIYSFNDKTTKNILSINKKVVDCGNKKFVVFPSHTYMDYAKSTIPQISIDWVSNVEAMNKSKLINEQILNAECLIIDKDYRFKSKNPKFGWQYKISRYND